MKKLFRMIKALFILLGERQGLKLNSWIGSMETDLLAASMNA